MSIELNQVDHREFQLGQINITEYDIGADRIIRLPLDRPKQEVVVDPSITEQIISPEKGKELSKVTVNPVTSQIDENIVARNIRAGVSILGVDGDLEPDKPDQEKTVTPTKETQEVVADAGYELAKAIVEPIPDEYIKPEGTLDIADNGNYDVKNYANVAVTVGGENKLAKLVSGQEVELTANDLEGMTTLRTLAFYYSSLKSIELPYGLTTIGSRAFEYCQKLDNITIPDSVTTIEEKAFYYCDKLTNVIIPDSAINLNREIFYNCRGLTSVTLPKTITTIPNHFLYYCNSLPRLEMSNSVTSIGQYAFYNCSALLDITLSNNLTTIGQYAFYNCSGIKDLSIIPSGVTAIQDGTFYGCRGFTALNIPKHITSIGRNAFTSCEYATSIIIPSSVTSIGDAAFSYCSRAQKVIFEGQAPNLLSNVFYSASAMVLYDFRNCTTIPTLASVNSLGKKYTGCQIVVPDALYDTWTTASVWSSVTNVVWVKASEYVES